MAVLLDTGFIYALLDMADRQHVSVARAYRQTRPPWLLATPVVTEIAYLLMSRQGPEMTANFVAGLASTQLALVEPRREDYQRAGALIQLYQDAPLDFVDSLIVAIAERLDVRTVLTVDQRHFRMVRPRHCEVFEILP